MLLWFFFKADSGIVVFLNTASLSHNTFVGPSIGIPNMQRLDVLNCRPHGNKLATQCTSLHRILPFTAPDNRSAVQEYENFGLRPLCYSVRCVDRIDKTMGSHCTLAWGQHGNWHFLLSIMVEIIPLVSDKDALINVRVPGTKE